MLIKLVTMMQQICKELCQWTKMRHNRKLLGHTKDVENDSFL